MVHYITDVALQISEDPYVFQYIGGKARVYLSLNRINIGSRRAESGFQIAINYRYMLAGT